jgi:hypothetical protein
MILKRGWQVVWLVMACVGCAGELEEPERFAFLFDDDDSGTGQPGPGPGPAMDASTPMPTAPPACVTALFQKSCGLTGCHSANAAQVDLVSPGVAARLIGKKSTSDDCMNRPFIATDGSASLLIEKLRSPAPCGSTMPIGAPLTTAETMCLTQWVGTVSN